MGPFRRTMPGHAAVTVETWGGSRTIYMWIRGCAYIPCRSDFASCDNDLSRRRSRSTNFDARVAAIFALFIAHDHAPAVEHMVSQVRKKLNYHQESGTETFPPLREGWYPSVKSYDVIRTARRAHKRTAQAVKFLLDEILGRTAVIAGFRITTARHSPSPWLDGQKSDLNSVAADSSAFAITIVSHLASKITPPPPLPPE